MRNAIAVLRTDLPPSFPYRRADCMAEGPGASTATRERGPKAPFERWRWGESNPRPTRCQRRHLRAQPTASFRNTRTLSASTLVPYPGLSYPAGPGNPGGGVPHCVALIRRGGHPPGGQERYLRCQCVTFVCTYMCTGSLTRTPVTSARFRRLNSHGRNDDRHYRSRCCSPSDLIHLQYTHSKRSETKRVRAGR